jgi:hypothetical protein
MAMALDGVRFVDVEGWIPAMNAGMTEVGVVRVDGLAGLLNVTRGRAGPQAPTYLRDALSFSKAHARPRVGGSC